MANKRKSLNCKRCVGGTLMTFGDELSCINCGWQAPAPKPVTAYSKILLARGRQRSVA